MKIYISGKISGLPIAEVKEKFGKSRKYLEAFGYEVVSPLDNGLPEGATWEEHMLADIELLFPCDAIYMLPDWINSNGAMIEKNIAQVQKKDIYFESSLTQDHRRKEHLGMILFKVESAIQEVTGLALADYTIRSRQTRLYFARMIFSHECDKAGITNKSLIGRYLKRDHATQIRALQQYQTELKYTADFREIAERVEALMNPVHSLESN